MPDLSRYLDLIDVARSSRARELSELRARFSASDRSDPFLVGSKAVVVLSYAAWEGFYNDCVEAYLDFLDELGCAVADVSWAMMIGSLSPAFAALIDKRHSPAARLDFVHAIRAAMAGGVRGFDRSVVRARSNLNFEKLAGNFAVLGFELDRLQASRIRLDKELVGWRHGVAHGNAPDLSAMDVAAHTEFAAELLLTLSDVFQDRMQSAAERLSRVA